jgi:hypothetical protein
MHRQHVALSEELRFAHRSYSVLGRLVGVEVLTPCDRSHAECLSDLRDLRPEPAQPQETEGLAVQPRADGDLPAASAHRTRLVDQVPSGTEDQRPGVLRGGVGEISRSAHGDAELARGPDIDGGVDRARADKELEAGEPRQHLGRERSAFPHGNEHVETGQPPDNLVGIRERPGKNHYLGVQGLPVGEARRDVLVVIEDRDLHSGSHVEWLRSRYASGPLSPSIDISVLDMIMPYVHSFNCIHASSWRKLGVRDTDHLILIN